MGCPKLYVSFPQRFRKGTVFLLHPENLLKLLRRDGYSMQLSQITGKGCLTFAGDCMECQTWPVILTKTVLRFDSGRSIDPSQTAADDSKLLRGINLTPRSLAAFFGTRSSP